MLLNDHKTMLMRPQGRAPEHVPPTCPPCYATGKGILDQETSKGPFRLVSPPAISFPYLLWSSFVFSTHLLKHRIQGWFHGRFFNFSCL